MKVDLNETLTTSPPLLTVGDAEAIAWDVYGLRARATVLSGERDQNFRLLLDDGVGYVLKAAHPAEAPGVLDFQTCAQLHIERVAPAVPVPRLIPTLAGDHIHWHGDAPAERRAIRLVSLLPGLLLRDVPRTTRVRRALGATLARFDLALAGFTHPQAKHVLQWDLQHAHRLRGLLEFIDDDSQRSLAAAHMDHFERHVLPRLGVLRRQVIHNDLNAYNVMVDAHRHEQITGIFDFGDLVEAPLVQDLAVACAYQLADAANPLETAAECVSAYHGVCPLMSNEIALLPDLIAARLLVTVAITGWRARQYPDNRAYILRNNPLSWNGLRRLSGLDPDFAADTMHRACQPHLAQTEQPN
ncbi:phosphotransferase (plasmid) [Burkholderia sp. FERM BP-3421]|uniref:phosphotransferase n=1 Tax=Burkholderia sp. FERM BP-3421 TaxID=1494466 RepID=UPI0023613EAF|nr:phosphotransferase [Burkholderia sp. FERM BP-3421]WDD90240.1 phosphotransferase [Burkholderia sp. FERM BP-3421]